MTENQQGLTPSETTDAERLRNSVLQRAANLIRSTQNPPEWPGAQFLKPKSSDRVFGDLDTRFAQHLSEFGLDEMGGVMVDGVSLDHAVLDHMNDPVAEDAESARTRGFWAGATEALDWIGITIEKWSKQSPDICALEALAAAEGIPTSRQSNHIRPETLVGAKVKKILGKKSFDYGTTNGIQRGEKGPIFLQLGKPKVYGELSEGYRKGVEVAFLHYVVLGQNRVRISQVEKLSKVF